MQMSRAAAETGAGAGRADVLRTAGRDPVPPEGAPEGGRRRAGGEPLDMRITDFLSK
ncbi:hypothetical protein MVI01_33780 [Myxococcus virescens]|uniref:Uncharacterized protein n=1 Tax=Myxococcus virescens TaxID=83456 RepID=A0A511HDU0_9BACT|nr:hypothetical protein MVI01_33780 [Myxococcus virescens]